MSTLTGWTKQALSIVVSMALLTLAAVGCATTSKTTSALDMKQAHHEYRDYSGVRFFGEPPLT